MRIDNITIPDSESSCAAWKLYYEELEKKFGTTNARDAWLYSWQTDGNSFCTKSTDFNKWASQNKIEVADGFDKAVSGVAQIGNNIIGGVGTLTGLSPKLASILLIGGVGLVLFLGYRIASKVEPEDIIDSLPVGKAGKLAGQIGAK